tara:strand:- start:258 stop:749 length:492 start_codon:yes stop_codon:yes gene_type:complete
MQKNKNISYLIIFFLVLVLIFSFTINKFQKTRNQTLKIKPISINLFTIVHPDLSWKFKPVKPKILVKPGEVKTVEYIVENLGSAETTGIATFAYFPNQFGNYISKINCFCYDAKTLKPKEKSIYTLVLLIDPEVTKDSKTKNIKEVTIQFTFFDYKKYKKQQS